MPPSKTQTQTPAATARLRAIAAYLAFRAIPLDAPALLSHFEHHSITDDLFAIDEEFHALLDRYFDRVCDDFLPTHAQQRQAVNLFREALATLVERIETSRIDGRAAHLDDRGCGCVLQILADALDTSWQTLREDAEIPLIIERFLWHVQPGENHHTCPTLALVRMWTLRALG